MQGKGKTIAAFIHAVQVTERPIQPTFILNSRRFKECGQSWGTHETQFGWIFMHIFKMGRSYFLCIISLDLIND